MRGRLDGLPNPLPFVEALPEVYREEPFVADLMAVFDDALAPVISVLDNIEAYFDPALAPSDYVSWLGGWFGLAPNSNWQLRQRRERVRRAVELFMWLGTPAGMRSYIAIYFDISEDDVEIHENGGVVASTHSGATPPGRPEPALMVRARVPNPEPGDVDRLDGIVTTIKPAHLVHRVEVVGS